MMAIEPRVRRRRNGKKIVIKSTGVHQPVSPYSHVIITELGKLICISDQVPPAASDCTVRKLPGKNTASKL